MLLVLLEQGFVSIHRLNSMRKLNLINWFDIVRTSVANPYSLGIRRPPHLKIYTYLEPIRSTYPIKKHGLTSKTKLYWTMFRIFLDHSTKVEVVPYSMLITNGTQSWLQTVQQETQVHSTTSTSYQSWSLIPLHKMGWTNLRRSRYTSAAFAKTAFRDS